MPWNLLPLGYWLYTLESAPHQPLPCITEARQLPGCRPWWGLVTQRAAHISFELAGKRVCLDLTEQSAKNFLPFIGSQIHNKKHIPALSIKVLTPSNLKISGSESSELTAPPDLLLCVCCYGKSGFWLCLGITLGQQRIEPIQIRAECMWGDADK